jgi:hypothetical protein
VSEDLCRAFMRDLEAHDLRGLERWFSESTTVCVPPCEAVRGTRRILAFFRTVFRSYDEIHWRMTDVYAVPGRRCIYLSESWGTRRGAEYRNHIVTVIDFDADGRITFLSDYFKDTVPFGGEGARAAS